MIICIFRVMNLSSSSRVACDSGCKAEITGNGHLVFSNNFIRQRCGLVATCKRVSTLGIKTISCYRVFHSANSNIFGWSHSGSFILRTYLNSVGKHNRKKDKLVGFVIEIEGSDAQAQMGDRKLLSCQKLIIIMMVNNSNNSSSSSSIIDAKHRYNKDITSNT